MAGKSSISRFVDRVSISIEVGCFQSPIGWLPYVFVRSSWEFKILLLGFLSVVNAAGFAFKFLGGVS